MIIKELLLGKFQSPFEVSDVLSGCIIFMDDLHMFQSPFEVSDVLSR